MEVRRIRVECGREAGRVRLVAEVGYERGTPTTEEYWFDVPEAVADGLSRSGNPWLVALLPLAVTLGEALRLYAPVDPVLIDGVRRVMEIWRAWYPELDPVGIEAEPLDVETEETGSLVATFFSGGVDSFFTALRPRDDAPGAERTRIDDLVTVGGFDVPLAAADAFARLRDAAAEAADDLAFGFLDVTTNLRTGRWDRVPWGPLGHGCALVGVALALAGRYRTALIPATGGYRDLHPWGSHPLTDPLLGTARMSVVHDGAAATRVDKLRLLVGSPTALRSLRVCWESRSDENCGRCPKCLRTMAALDLLGALDRCASFPADRLEARRIQRLRCRESWDYRELRDLRRLAKEVGRGEMAEAASRAMRRSRARDLFSGGASALASALLPRLRRCPL